MKVKDTGEMCLINVFDPNREDEIRYVDLGNYYIDDNGDRCIIITEDKANKYKELIPANIYLHKGGNKDV